MGMEFVMKVSLSGAPDHSEQTVVLPDVDHMKAAAIALRRFRRMGYQRFRRGAGQCGGTCPGICRLSQRVAEGAKAADIC
jgi:hypothetical protein